MDVRVADDRLFFQRMKQLGAAQRLEHINERLIKMLKGPDNASVFASLGKLFVDDWGDRLEGLDEQLQEFCVSVSILLRFESYKDPLAVLVVPAKRADRICAHRSPSVCISPFHPLFERT